MFNAKTKCLKSASWGCNQWVHWSNDGNAAAAGQSTRRHSQRIESCKGGLPRVQWWLESVGNARWTRYSKGQTHLFLWIQLHKYLLKMSDGDSSIAVYVHSNVYKVTRGMFELSCMLFNLWKSGQYVFILWRFSAQGCVMLWSRCVRGVCGVPFVYECVVCSVKCLVLVCIVCMACVGGGKSGTICQMYVFILWWFVAQE